MVAQLLEAHVDKAVGVFLQSLKLNSGPSHYLFINWKLFFSRIFFFISNYENNVALQSLSVE